MIVKYWIDRGVSGNDIEDEIELDDDATDHEIDEAVKEEMCNVISYGWEKKDSPNG
ncbi:MAG: hypothetical protein WDN46_17550 [Methylocella sp.]